MGDARNNVLSPQFRGELPQKMCGCVIGTEIMASAEWIAANPIVEGQPVPVCPPDSLEVVVVIAGQTTTPSALEPDPRKWVRSAVRPVLELARVPMRVFLDLVEGGAPQEAPVAPTEETPPAAEQH